jgi:hypothetical protein
LGAGDRWKRLGGLALGAGVAATVGLAALGLAALDDELLEPQPAAIRAAPASGTTR